MPDNLIMGMVKLFVYNKSPSKEGLKDSCNLSGAEGGT